MGNVARILQVRRRCQADSQGCGRYDALRETALTYAHVVADGVRRYCVDDDVAVVLMGRPDIGTLVPPTTH